MSATKLPDAALLGAVADLLAETHKANHASVRDLVAELARSRERIDQYGNVIETKFQALEIEGARVCRRLCGLAQSEKRRARRTGPGWRARRARIAGRGWIAGISRRARPAR